jgi:ergothioneine biosynthesis protein EgtB
MQRSASREALNSGPGPLSVALIDARNHTLSLLTHHHDAIATHGLQVPREPGFELPQWLAGHVGWFAEWWIGRNPRRGQGANCPADVPRLPSVEPLADRWYHPLQAPHDSRRDLALPDAQEVRGYLLQTLEQTLDLLEHAEESEDGLYFFRAALFHEDLRGEQFAVQAQAMGIALPLRLPPPAPAREPIALPATRWQLGMPAGVFARDVELGAHEVPVPEFEIDAQPVQWSQYVEFVDDGGYDREELWHPDGWRWLQATSAAEGRRGPRHVEQIGVASGAVMQGLFGKATRMPGAQAVMHVSWWEADAYSRWAGRRLATEVEWEIAAHQAASRGFRWGDVQEWTAGTLRPWTGYQPAPWTRHGDLEGEPVFGTARVLRGASFATAERLRHPRRRSFALPGWDHRFTGFRTCAV